MELAYNHPVVHAFVLTMATVVGPPGRGRRGEVGKGEMFSNLVVESGGEQTHTNVMHTPLA